MKKRYLFNNEKFKSNKKKELKTPSFSAFEKSNIGLYSSMNNTRRVRVYPANQFSIKLMEEVFRDLFFGGRRNLNSNVIEKILIETDSCEIQSEVNKDKRNS